MKRVLILAVVGEAATGLALLIAPSLVGRLLLGVELSGVSVVIGRVTGIALVGLAIACWPGRTSGLRGMFTYSAAATAYLAWVAIRGEWVGPLLWPAVVLHAVMTTLLGLAWLRSPTTGKQDKRTSE